MSNRESASVRQPALVAFPRLTRRALTALDVELAALVRCLDRHDGRAAHERALRCRSMIAALSALDAENDNKPITGKDTE